jgi:chromosome segregation ATPase
LVIAAAAEAGSGAPNAGRQDPAEASWRQRALNAEEELKRAHAEVVAQRGQIGELHGRIRDLEHDLPADGIQRVLTENQELRIKLPQAATDQRRLEERLAGARDNNRSLDKRVAELEAELAGHMVPRPGQPLPDESGRQTRLALVEDGVFARP